jgi:hypothetical protein
LDLRSSAACQRTSPRGVAGFFAGTLFLNAGKSCNFGLVWHGLTESDQLPGPEE